MKHIKQWLLRKLPSLTREGLGEDSRKIHIAMIFVIAVIAIVAMALVIDRFPRFGTLPHTDAVVDYEPPYPNPYSDLQPFMEGFYVASHDASISVASNTRVLIVPHHLVASKTIAVGISSLTKTSFKHIVLLSPDHFAQCPTLFCTTPRSFETFFGIASSSPENIYTLASSSLVTVAPDLFKSEHGIYAVLPFIVHDYPGVDVTPLVLSQKIPWKNQREALLKLLDSVIDEQTVLIISSDFSHYLPLAESNQKDTLTEQSIVSQNLDAIASLQNPQQSDCPGCLWLATSVAKDEHCEAPHILLHTNSATILHDESVQRTTSHYAIQWVGSK